MPLLIDTDIAIHLRDGDPEVTARLEAAHHAPVISAVTLCELEAGVGGDRSLGGERRRLLDYMLSIVPVLPFTPREAAVYGTIVAATGYDRRRVLDRMIAAQAIAADFPLATINDRDFRDIPGLDLQVWSTDAKPPPDPA